MSRALRTVAMVAGAVALTMTGIGAIAGAGIMVAGASTATIATVASLTATAASVGAQLTAKKPGPSAYGAVTDTIIQVDPPQPYMMGRTYSAGVVRHDIGYGPEIDDVKNPYLGKVVVYSGSGPIQEIESRQFDYQPINFAGGWYFGYVGAPGQLGLTPESSALASVLGTIPNWGSDYKLSGQAAVLWNFHFDKKGKKFANGLPPYGIVAKGVHVYDPRQDSTFPGGSGPCRLGVESTYVGGAAADNPACHGITYAYGRYQNGKRVFGVGLPASGIDLARFAAFANVCDANNWKVGGTIFEPGDPWANLKDILAAGGAEPVFAGGMLTVRYRAPMVALETVYEGDVADDDISVTAMPSYRDRLNGVVPKYRSEAHHWQYVSTETVTVPAYVTEDGEEKTVEHQFNLVQQAKQAAELAAYELVDGRELGPITITLKPWWRRYKPGECLHLYIPAQELDHDAIILSRHFDPATMTVKLTLITEDPDKHAFALGQTPTPPPSPTLTNPADRDEAAADPYVAHLPNLTNPTGVLLPEVVNTPNIVPGAVTVGEVLAPPDVFCPAGVATQFIETPWMAVGENGSGQGLVSLDFTVDSTSDHDGSARLTFYYDTGAGWTLAKQRTMGITTDNGDSWWVIPGMFRYRVAGTQVRIRGICQPGIWMPSAQSNDMHIRDIIYTVFGGKV